MARSSHPPRGIVLSTGLRIVGSGAERLAEKLETYATERLRAPGPHATLYAVQCTFEPASGGRPTVERVLDAITGQLQAVEPALPRLVRDEPVDLAPSRFGGLRFEHEAEAGRHWTGEVLWRTVHPAVAGAPVTTRALIEERPAFTRLTVRVVADEGLPSVRGELGAGQAQPAFLRGLGLTPVWLGGPLRPHVIPRNGVVDFVHSVLGSETRDHPVVVLAPLEEGGFVVEPEALAWDLLGRARLYVLAEHAQTFALTDTVGDRRMSAYWGAAHGYMPGWSRHDDPFEHPLAVRDKLADPVLRARWLGELGLWMAERVEFPPGVLDRDTPSPGDERRPEPTTPAREPAAQAPTGGAPDPGDAAGEPEARERAEVTVRPVRAAGGQEAPAAIETAPAPPAADPSPLLHELLGEVRRLTSAITGLGLEVERLRTISALRSSSTNAIERRLGRLEEILEQAFPDGTGSASGGRDEEAGAERPERRPDADGPSLVEVVQDAAESGSDVLLFLDSAFRSAEDSPYEDPERVREQLEAMALVARWRRDGVLEKSLRETFGELGVKYRVGIARSTPARLRQQYRFKGPKGQLVEAEEHIVLGDTYDPRRCLRIYFSSKVPNEDRFVIGHVGRHFEVITST